MQDYVEDLLESNWSSWKEYGETPEFGESDLELVEDDVDECQWF